MTTTINGVTSNLLTGFSYEPMGPVTGWIYGNGLTRFATMTSEGEPRLSRLSEMGRAS
ncbi:MAG: hypothetical protein ACHP7D_10450 [Lysobacterales bacterium]